jgi:hypothetical protein
MDRNLCLDRLTMLLGESGREAIYLCIGDLVVNGLQASRFAPSDHVPNRQDVTQYLAAWCRDAHLSEDACRAWLCDYAVSTLSSLSNSSPSGIRHSTKSNVKYIYRSDRPFICEREGNGFRAECSKSCRVYSEMAIKAATTTADSLAAMDHRHAVAPEITSVPSVKEVYREQFRSSMQLVSRELSKGTKKTGILDLLKQQGMKTRTGREWTYGILVSEIQKRGHKHQQETAGGSS